jgi:hypothetical protein
MSHQVAKYSSSNFLKSSSVKTVDSSLGSEDGLSVLHFTLLSKICKPQYKVINDGPHHKQKIRIAVPVHPSECTVVHRMCELGIIRDEHFDITNARAINLFATFHMKQVSVKRFSSEL